MAGLDNDYWLKQGGLIADETYALYDGAGIDHSPSFNM
jgi:hypothetical protein